MCEIKLISDAYLTRYIFSIGSFPKGISYHSDRLMIMMISMKQFDRKLYSSKMRRVGQKLNNVLCNESVRLSRCNVLAASQSELVLVSLYAMRWQARGLRFQRALLLAMTRARRTLRPVAGRVVPLSLQTYVTVTTHANAHTTCRMMSLPTISTC